MTIYEKPRAELFAQDAPDSEIEPFTAWLRGLGIAFDETGGLPKMESFNGLLQSLNGYIKYLEQNGFAEWSSDLEYPVGAGVRVGAAWYRAKTQNLDKPPATSQNDWAVFLNASDLAFSDPIQLMNGVVSIKDATTTQKGVVRVATSSEVASRSNVNAFVKPSDLPQPAGVPNASTVTIGVSRFANTAEVNNKSSAIVAVNPSNVATIAQSTDLGVGQTWRNVTGSRALGGTYTNNTGKPIFVAVTVTNATYVRSTMYVGGVVVGSVYGDVGSGGYVEGQMSVIVPSGSSYSVSGGSIRTWSELS